MESYHTLFFPQRPRRSTTGPSDGEIECGSTARIVDQKYQRRESSVVHDADRRMNEKNSEQNS